MNTEKDALTSKDVVSEVREVYGRTLDRDAHGTGHYEGCWKDHWACLAEKLLDHIGRITPVETSGDLTELEELLRDVAANGKRNWSIAAHRQLVRMGLVGSPEEPRETTVSLATYERVVKGRSDFRQAYKQARSLLRQFMAAWEGQPNHENMDRLCEAARGIAGSPEEPSPVLDHRFIPEGMDPGICQKCGATRASHRDTREGIVFAEKAAESSPDQLVGALQDRVHQDLGRVRAGRSVKASGEHVHEWHPLPRGVNFCVTCDAVFKPLFGVDLAPGESRSGWMCTKHGVINGPDCDKCKQGSEEPKHGV